MLLVHKEKYNYNTNYYMLTKTKLKNNLFSNSGMHSPEDTNNVNRCLIDTQI